MEYWLWIAFIDVNVNNGFIEFGCVKLSGSQDNGDAIIQTFSNSNQIVGGKKYKLSIAVRFLNSENSLDYVKIRAVAFSNNLSLNSSHPSPTNNIAIIGRSGKIHDCGDWSVIEFPVWIANKNFTSIGINAFTNDNTKASLYIDEITLCETSQSPCDEIALDNNQKPIPPFGSSTLLSGILCDPEEDEDAFFNGSLVDLYPGYDGTSSIYNSMDPCNNIGGTLPPEVLKISCDDSLKALGINMTCEELETLLNTSYDPAPPVLPLLPAFAKINNFPCDTPTFPPSFDLSKMAFHGRDIIYVHGLMLSHLCDRANGIKGATEDWPANPNEFYNGYYKAVADANWDNHIKYFKTDKGNLNRYLIVSYNCSQPAKVAVHSILAQIIDAMETGRGVIADPNDPRDSLCFGRDFVMISHSTGAIIADVALSIANKTKTDLNLSNEYGNLGLISDRCKGRVSIRGAQSGSNLATILAYAQADPQLSALASLALTGPGMTPCDKNWSINVTQNMIFNSVIMDLVPSVTRLRWGSYINDISVPVFTVAGGHPSAILSVLKYLTLSGFDDGVVNLDCANGTCNVLSPSPSSFNADPRKTFDMGIPTIRAVHYFLDQKVGAGITGVFASGSIPYLSPTGMVQPITSIINHPQIHYDNHFSFIQSCSEHWLPQVYYHLTDCEYDVTLPGKSSNTEEELVVFYSNLFSPTLIDPAIISQMVETIREKHINYPWIKMVTRHGIPRPTIIWKKFYIWKRTYHTLNDNCMFDADYAYKYLFTN
ncbi:MAG: hypothetical protein IPL92_17960 [Saprospiraceae bacterium]|nr:hypothetical protein [Candidatus Opimibacter iunctus]